MMRPVRQIRQHLQNTIPDAFFPIDPEETFRGQEQALELWRDAVPLWGDEDNEGFIQVDNASFAKEDDGSEEDSVRALDELFEIGAAIDEAELQSALGGTQGQRIRQSVLLHGVEALAWYMPFHAPGAQWGVYIPVSSLVYMAGEILARPNAGAEEKLRLAFRALHQHELFHFATEYMSSQWEAITGQPCYKPARALKDSDNDPMRGYILQEEELANGHMLRACRRRIPGGTGALRRFVLDSPPGYRDGGNRVQTTAFVDGCEELSRRYIGRIAEGAMPPGRPGLDALNLFPLYPLTPAIDWRHCPVHIIHDESRLGISPLAFHCITQVTSIGEAEGFRKTLLKLPSQNQRAWEQGKKKLARSTSLHGLDFQLFSRETDHNIYSVAAGGGYRVHIEHKRQIWQALKAGTHKEMGHEGGSSRRSRGK